MKRMPPVASDAVFGIRGRVSRKGAKAQREPEGNAAALCVFAPLRETFCRSRESGFHRCGRECRISPR